MVDSVLTIRDIKFRAVNAPLARPIRTAVGAIPSAPLLLIDVGTDQGIVGRSYIFTYTIATLAPVARLAAEIIPELVGQPVVPVDIQRNFDRRFRLLGRQGLLGMLMPILAVVLTFSVLFTFTDFQLVYAITRGGPLNTTHLMATLAFQRAIPGGDLGQGAAISTAMIPFLVVATLFSYYGLQRRKWQQGGSDD